MGGRAPGQVNGGSEILAAAKGGGYLASGSLYEFASRMVIAFLLARTIGAEGYGLYILAITTATVIAAAAGMGLDDAMVRYVAIMVRRGDAPGLWGTVRIGVGLSASVGVVLAVAMFVGARPIAEGLFDEPALVPSLRLLAFAVPFLVLSNALLGCARGFGRMGYATMAENVIQSTVRMVLLGLLSLVEIDVIGAVAAFGLADVAAAVTLLVLLSRELPQPPWRHQPARHDFGAVLRFALPLWISGLISQFRRNIQALFLGAMASVASVGVYTIVNRVNFIGHITYRSVVSSVKPSLARLHDQGDREGLQRVYAASTRWTVGANIPFFLVMVLYAQPILAVFGGAFTSGADALVVLAFAELALSSTGICGSILDMTGHTRVKLFNSFLAVATLVVANWLLIPHWGILGAAYAALVATVIVESARVVEVWILERVHPYGGGWWKPYTALAAGAAVGAGLQRAWPVGTSLGVMAVQGAVVVGAYVASLTALGVAEDDRLVLDRVVARMRRRRRRVTRPPVAAGEQAAAPQAK